jgi:hypothetical protein
MKKKIDIKLLLLVVRRIFTHSAKLQQQMLLARLYEK